MGLVFTQNWTVDGTATDATSATIAIHDDTAGTDPVAAATAMDHVATGQYQYNLADALAEHVYTATITVIYDGDTYTYQSTAAVEAAEPEITPAAGSDAPAIEQALVASAAGAWTVQTAAGSMTGHRLDLLIEAANREAAIRARRAGLTGLTTFRITGGGDR